MLSPPPLLSLSLPLSLPPSIARAPLPLPLSLSLLDGGCRVEVSLPFGWRMQGEGPQVKCVRCTSTFIARVELHRVEGERQFCFENMSEARWWGVRCRCVERHVGVGFCSVVRCEGWRCNFGGRWIRGAECRVCMPCYKNQTNHSAGVVVMFPHSDMCD